MAIANPSSFTSLRYQELLKTKPESQSKVVRVWSIRKTPEIRINLVEFTGEIAMHKHPDADHSLLVLEGNVRVQIGDEKFEIGKGDFVSVPKDVPHKYWTLGERAILVSMDAPYYDPKKTVPLETLTR